MDANKLKVLQELGYQIPPTCGICKHGEFKPQTPWGTCKLHTYQHVKHTGDRRQLSIYQGGRCDKLEPDPSRVAKLERFAEFLGP